jgi:hypothetical protein
MAKFFEINYEFNYPGYIYTVRFSEACMPLIYFYRRGGSINKTENGFDRHFVKIKPKKGVVIKCDITSIGSINVKAFERGVKIVLLDLGDKLMRAGVIDYKGFNPIFYQTGMFCNKVENVEKFLSCFNFSQFNINLNGLNRRRN